MDFWMWVAGFLALLGVFKLFLYGLEGVMEMMKK